ncbi:hypothetical protein GW17_00033112 [Ensete ventricosum]|nr:hypothetical protein GW17_00033112 [Ensete ventricosum]
MGVAALVALGEEPEGVDLPDEVGHAGPSAEPEADDEHPPHHEGVHHVHPRPARQEEGRLLRSILQDLEGDLGIWRGKKDGYLSCRWRPVGEHMCQSGDDVDGEADEESAHRGVDGTKEGEDDGQEPDGDDDGKPGEGAQADALGVMHSDHLLPHEVQRGAGEAEGDELVDQHQDDGGVPPPRLGQQREGVGVRQKLVAEGPVGGGRRRQRQGEHVHRGQQVDVLELLRFPHRVHDLPAHKCCSETMSNLQQYKNMAGTVNILKQFPAAVYCMHNESWSRTTPFGRNEEREWGQERTGNDSRVLPPFTPTTLQKLSLGGAMLTKGEMGNLCFRLKRKEKKAVG